MMTATLISVGAAWLLALLSLSLNLAGVRRWQGRSSRLRNAGGLVMFTGLLIDLLVHWPARPWVVALPAMLLILAGAACVLASGIVREVKAEPPAGLSDGSPGRACPRCSDKDGAGADPAAGG